MNIIFTFIQYISIMRFIFLLFVSVCLHSSVNGQPKAYTLANAHSHNDYLQSKPLTSAFQAGFGSIEADIFPVNGDLLVAHTDKELDPSRTLKTLYLNPLKKLLKGRAEELQLLIDIKTDTKTSMDLLIKQLQPLKKYLSTLEKKGKLKIVMTGKIPLPENYSDYPDYIFYDHDLKQTLKEQQWKRIGMVSVNFKNYSKWKGKGKVAPEELDKMKDAIGQAHLKNKPFRFWGMPDQSQSWSLQKALGTDWIGTDHIDALKVFISEQKR